MQPEPLAAFHQALRLGPGYCPPDLFGGSVAAVVRGLKVHANNIAHARHVALEETYPRLLEAMGAEAFHQAAARFLAQPLVLDRSLDDLGRGFEQILDHPAQRDLARAEWLWLEAFGAPEASAITLAELASFAPERLLAASFQLHPAARWTPLEQPTSFGWDGSEGEGEILLVTRPAAELHVRRIPAEAAEPLGLLSRPRAAGDLLAAHSVTLIKLVEAGAITLETSDED